MLERVFVSRATSSCSWSGRPERSGSGRLDWSRGSRRSSVRPSCVP